MQIKSNQIEAFLQQKIGIDPKIIGSRKIAKAVENRLAISGEININTYLNFLRTSPSEFTALVELLIVPETWFFRERQAFDFMSNYLRLQWLSQNNKTRLRLLSIPCSSGEEPYSLAMQLLDIGFLPSQFQIDAIDLSQNSLEKAKKALYTRNSFRGNNLEFQNRYFTQINQEYQLNRNIRELVNFTQNNLLESDFLKNQAPYDIIFCRNLLIYFDTIARDKTLKTLKRLLKNKGLLFVAASETNLIAELGFEIIRSPYGLAGQKNTTLEPIKYSPPIQTLPDSKLLRLKTQQEINPEKTQTNPRSAPTITPQPARQPDKSFDTVKTLPTNNPWLSSEQTTTELENINLETIRHLADQGNLTEASARCETYLKKHSTNAEAYVLLAQIYHAQKLEIQAEKYFQKALYLDPKNSQAILHLLLLKEQQGEISKAAILRQRLQRLQTS